MLNGGSLITKRWTEAETAVRNSRDVASPHYIPLKHFRADRRLGQRNRYTALNRMPYQATIFNVMVASPGDVAAERQIIRDVVSEWNAIHSRDRNMVLMSMGWETHSSPLIGDRPQAIINRQVLQHADLLIAVFWTRLGTPTGEAASGTVEEIEEHLAAGKPAMIYFSSAPVRLDSVDESQYQALREFKSDLQQRGLYETYDTLGDFRAKLARQLAQTVIKHFTPELVGDATESFDHPNPDIPVLSDPARELLLEASQDRGGSVLVARYLGGMSVETNGRNFINKQSARVEALWEGAVQELCNHGLLQERGYKGEVFSVTTLGFEIADLIRNTESAV